jgi:hypothetical protein
MRSAPLSLASSAVDAATPAVAAASTASQKAVRRASGLLRTAHESTKDILKSNMRRNSLQRMQSAKQVGEKLRHQSQEDISTLIDDNAVIHASY